MFSCIKDLLHRCKIAPSEVSPTQQSARAMVTCDITEASSAVMQCIADALPCNVYCTCTKRACAVVDKSLYNLTLFCSSTFWSSTVQSSTPHRP